MVNIVSFVFRIGRISNVLHLDGVINERTRTSAICMQRKVLLSIPKEQINDRHCIFFFLYRATVVDG